ncbi:MULTISPECIES: sugar MFS transporter [unclassified Kosmotoga]|uniref:MFS transporter n=1 Tax=unclassified Kosmotoga TaxID=2631489 RepID=UPI0007C4EE24|nr:MULTISPECIES: MFS transporter [unclassified Kosmotoga]MDI3524048.1 transporter, family, glucose/mannose:H+ symporter [Kosmotoga sp.]MDK2953467.1 transporter, family, glucose/mannose:H+ symporter [Kosmotoga sp.]OAA19140.1 hypothetical protein DU53_10990 [Kosmotoga sp. DU53]
MREKNLFTLAASGGFFSFGFTAIALGSVLPAIEIFFGIDHQMAGLLLSLPSIFFIIAAILSIKLTPRFGPFKMLMIAILTNTFGYLLIGLSPTFILLLIASFITTFGNSLIEVNAGVGVAALFKKRTGSVLNVLHSLFSLGAVISPFVVALTLKNVKNWNIPFFIGAAITAFTLFLSFPTIKIPFLYSENRETRNPNSITDKKERTLYWLVLSGVFLYVGYEVGFSSWVAAYLFDVRDVSLRFSSIFPALLWMGLLAGRLVAGITVEKLGYSRSLLLLSSFSCITFVAMLLTKAPIILGLFTFLIGLGFSAMFPTLQAILISQRPERSSFNVSTFSIAASLGAAASSYMVGFAGKHFGLEKGILIVLMLIVAEIFVTLLIHLQIQKS